MFAVAWLLLRGPLRPHAPGGPRQRARGRLLRRQPRALQDARLRDQRLLRGRRRLAARDRDHLRQPGHVPDHALDLPARRRRRRRSRLALAARLRGDLHPLHADRVGAARGERDPGLPADPRATSTPTRPGRPRWRSASILILIMLAFPGGAAGLIRRLKVARATRRGYDRARLGSVLTGSSCSPAALARGAIATARRARAPTRGSTDDDDPARRHRAALRPAVGVRVGRPWRERVLQVRERARRRQRPHDRLQGRRRRVRPGPGGAGDRAGSSSRTRSSRSSTRSAPSRTSRRATT